MEKSKRTYGPEEIKRTFFSAESLERRITASAYRCAQELGFARNDIVQVIQGLRPKDFYKSMTAYRDHRLWQDVYRTRFENITLYVKFMKDEEGLLLLSLKRK